MGGGAPPTLADADTLTAPDGVSLNFNLDMAIGAHAQLMVVLATLFGPNHPTTLATKEVNVEIMERETELEEYNPRDQGFKARLPESSTCWL